MPTMPGHMSADSPRGRTTSVLAGLDWWLLGGALVVTGFGVYVVKVATDGDIAADPGFFFTRQVAYALIGLVALFFTLRLDLEWLSRYVWTIYAVLIAAVTLGAALAAPAPAVLTVLGLQLLFETSEEGNTRCLGVFPGTARRFLAAPGHTVPHMGWNQLRPRSASPLLAGIREGDYAYFVHSYALPVGEHTIASCDYGGEFSAVVGRGNFYGTQFHPERSAEVGARILANFLELG
jgi:hypothetical protein